jgi:hypothetical protein
MITSTANSTKQSGKAVLHKAKNVAANPWIERLERFGFVIRGLIYFIIGVLALQLALGAGGATATPTSAIALIGRQPMGQLLLVIVAAGLAGYALWGFVRAIFDPLGKGTEPKGLLARAGFLFSGVSYAVLLIPVVLTLLNKPSTSTASSTAGVPAAILTGPYGKWIIVAFGLFWIAAGAAQVITGYKAKFVENLNTGAMSAQEVKLVTWLGRIGYAARGAVFALVGVIILQTAFAVGPKQAQGFDGALAALAHAPYGEILLGVVAVGLILFGAYSALCAKWNKVGIRQAA